MNLKPVEEQALKDVSELIKYCAESQKTLPEAITKPISEAWSAQEENKWNTEVASKFWTAYTSLCELIKPVTLNTIETAKPKKYRRWIFFGDEIDRTLAQKTASIYRALLILMLFMAIALGFLGSTLNAHSSRIYELKAQGNSAASGAEESIATIMSVNDDKTNSQSEKTKLRTNLRELSEVTADLCGKFTDGFINLITIRIMIVMKRIR